MNAIMTRSLPWVVHSPAAVDCEAVRAKQLEPYVGVVTVDFYVESPHEGDYLGRYDPPRTMIGKPGGYGITKFADTSSGPSRRRWSMSLR